MEKIKELKDYPEYIVDPETREKVYRPSSESVEEWSREVQILYQKFLRLQQEGRLSK